MNFQSACLLLLWVGVAVHAHSDICCLPDQWERTEMMLMGIVSECSPERYIVKSKVYYDFTNTRVAKLITVSTGLENFNIQYLQIYTNATSGTQYVYDIDTKRCTKTPLAAPFKKECLPDNATKVRDLVFGLGDQTIAATEYKLKDQNQDVTITTTSSCVPITATISGTIETPTEELYLMKAVEFSDIKFELSRTDVFTIPSECQEAPPPPKGGRAFSFSAAFSSFRESNI